MSDFDRFISDSQASAPCYYDVPKDGAPVCCVDCRETFQAKEVFYTVTPVGVRQVVCKDCLCEDWLKSARYMGQLPI